MDKTDSAVYRTCQVMCTEKEIRERQAKQLAHYFEKPLAPVKTVRFLWHYSGNIPAVALYNKGVSQASDTVQHPKRVKVYAYEYQIHSICTAKLPNKLYSEILSELRNDLHA